MNANQFSMKDKILLSILPVFTQAYLQKHGVDRFDQYKHEMLTKVFSLVDDTEDKWRPLVQVKCISKVSEVALTVGELYWGRYSEDNTHFITIGDDGKSVSLYSSRFEKVSDEYDSSVFDDLNMGDL